MTTWDKTVNIRHPITRMYQFFKSNGTRELLTVSKQQLHREKNGVLETIGNLSSNEVKMMTYKNRNGDDSVLFADGGSLKIYGGTNLAEATPHVPDENEQTNPGLNDLVNLTNFRTFTLKKDRIYAAAHPTLKNRVSFSYFDPYLGSGVFDYFPATYFFDVATEDNDEIVEFKVFREALIIFCKRSVWALYGEGADLAGLELVKINVPAGCVSSDSVQEVGNNLFYLAEDHIYSLFSTDQSYISAKAVSENVQQILKVISTAEKEKSTGAFHDNKYYLSFPSGLTLVYDITLEAWTKYTNIQANDFLVMDNVLYFSGDDGFIYRFSKNKYTDDGTPISFLIKSKIIDFKAPIHRKKIRRMWVVQKQWAEFDSSYDLFGMVDQYDLIDLKVLQVKSGAGATWDESLWDDALWDFSQVAQDEIKLRKKAKSIQFQITNNNPDEPITIYGLAFEYQMKKP